METDRERWDTRYATRTRAAEIKPDALLVEHCELLTGRGRALDVAAGRGQNALFLASLGYESYALDVSLVGLRIGTAAARQRGLPFFAIVADLDRYPLPSEWFAVIVVVRYLNRNLLPALKDALMPGGMFFYETFNANYSSQKPDFNPAYLLEPGELARIFSDFRTILTNDSDTITDATTYWIGQKPPHG